MTKYFIFCFIIFAFAISYAEDVEQVETDTIIVTDTKTKEKGQTIMQADLQNMNVYSLWGWNYDYHMSVSLHGKYDKNKLKLNFLAFYDIYDNSMSMYSSLIHVDYD